MAKHLNVAEESNNKSKNVMVIILVLIIGTFVFGMGENYLAQRSYEEHLEEMAQHERILDEFEDAMAGYQRAMMRTDPSYKYEIHIAEDGDGAYLDESDAQSCELNQHYGWTELVEKTNRLRLETEAATYSF